MAAWCLCAVTVAAASPYGFIGTLGDGNGSTAVSGNGRLTVGVNAFGHIDACRWPGPARANQISSVPADPETDSRYGLLWGLRIGDKTVWLDGAHEITHSQSVPANGPIIRTQSDLDGVPGAVVQETFVLGDRDVLVARIQVSPAMQGQAIWYADASPCSTVVPELPFLSFLWRGGQDFAAFADETRRTVYQFRPKDLAAQDWAEARRWISDPETPQPEVFQRDGVWIAYACAGGLQSSSCSDGTHAGPSAVGDCTATAVPTLEDGDRVRTATMYVAFGASRKGVDDDIAFALERGYDALRQSMLDAWEPVLAGASHVLSPDSPEFREPLLHELTTLSIATSQESGAIVRAPGSQPVLALDYPRHSIWAGLALDFLGLTETSQRHLEFLLSLVRIEDRTGMPAGSLPVAVYGDGTQGLPHAVLDGEAAGWLLWAVQQHDTFLSGERHEAFIADSWPALDNLATFLMSRSDVDSGIPPYSFNSRALREETTDDFLIACCVGLRSASALAHLAGQDRPEWAARVKALEDALESRAFSTGGTWTAARPLSYWAAGILDPGDPRWDAATQQALASLDAAPPDEALRTLCDLAFLWRDQPGRLQTLKPILLPAIERARAVRPVDSLDAARAILAIVMACGS